MYAYACAIGNRIKHPVTGVLVRAQAPQGCYVLRVCYGLHKAYYVLTVSAGKLKDTLGL